MEEVRLHSVVFYRWEHFQKGRVKLCGLMFRALHPGKVVVEVDR